MSHAFSHRKKKNLNRIIARPLLNPIQSLLWRRLAIRVQRSLFTSPNLFYFLLFDDISHVLLSEMAGLREPRVFLISYLSLVPTIADILVNRYQTNGDTCRADAYARGKSAYVVAHIFAFASVTFLHNDVCQINIRIRLH